jgi:steroid 5-alpha reductase family enzyme
MIADKQLAKFVKNKKSGEILTSGLRKYHRYPQYF